MASDRYKRGLDKFREIDGKAGERIIELLKDTAPDLARYSNSRSATCIRAACYAKGT